MHVKRTRGNIVISMSREEFFWDIKDACNATSHQAWLGEAAAHVLFACITLPLFISSGLGQQKPFVGAVAMLGLVAAPYFALAQRANQIVIRELAERLELDPEKDRDVIASIWKSIVSRDIGLRSLASNVIEADGTRVSFVFENASPIRHRTMVPSFRSRVP